MFFFYRPTRRFTLAFTFLLAAGTSASAYLLSGYLFDVLHGDPADWRYAAFAGFALVVGCATLVFTEKYGQVDFYKAGGPPITQIKTLFWSATTRLGFGDKDDMSYADRVRWSHVDSIPFAGELTALWLEGKLASQPGYCGPVDTDEKYAAGMTAVLAAVNRGGFLTRDSQAGLIETIDGEEVWVQFAAVAGFADMDTLPVIQEVIDGTPGLEWSFCGDPDAYGWEDAFFPVTFRAHPGALDLDGGYYGEPYTDFGNPVPDGDIADDGIGFGICRPELVRKLTAATQIVVADVEPGRNDRLWLALDEIASRLPRNWAFRTLLHRVPSSTE